MKIVVGGQIDKQKVYDAVSGVVGDQRWSASGHS